MQQQAITMLVNISTSGGDNIDNNLQRSTGNGITSTTQAQIVKLESINAHHNQDHRLNNHQNQHQFEQLQQPTTTQQQPPLQNGPKPRGRRKKIRTEPIRPICPQCEKQFSNQSALTKHKLTHSDERKYACQQCSKAFKRHDHLTGHMQTHSNRKPFNCTIQGCDKTYCDARSLRRHKENIHHIVTQTQEPSHLLRRRIQRLHSDQGLYNRSVEHHQLNCVTAPPHSLPQTSLTPQQVSTTSTSTITPNGNSNHQSASYLNHHGLAGQHGSFSADYASTQHFNFDFVPVNGGGQSGHHHGHLHHHHHHDHHPASHHDHHQDSYLDHHINGLEHTLNTGSVPHSADSVSDSGLGLNIRYEQHTPQPLAPPPPPPRLYSQQHHHQQASHHVSYSAGYASTQHFDFDFVNNPDQGVYNRNVEHHHMNCVTAPPPPQNLPPQTTNLTPQQVATTPTTAQTPNGNSNSGNHQSASYINHNSHAGNHGSFSADYASTQHFNFDFVPVSGGANGIGQSAHNNHHYHQDRHPGSNQNHQNGYLNNHVTSLEHTLSTDSVPHSTDSVTDSGLSLNVHYEQQHMLQPQPRMREAYSN